MEPPESPHRLIDDGPEWLAEIIARLEENPAECGPAFEALASVDEVTRAEVIAALARYRDRDGVRDLLGLLESGTTPATPLAVRPGPTGREIAHGVDSPDARIARSLVTAVNGAGRGTIVISTVEGGCRRTAAFLCDVRHGLIDAVGEVEEDGPSAGRLFDEWVDRADERAVVDVPVLAFRLLDGCARLGGRDLPERARIWLGAMLGPADRPAGIRATLPGPDIEPIPFVEIAGCAERVLDACPDWLDRSPLTRELAVEIALREGSATPDPVRDAGAYRFLFEHLFFGRLDLYARMLLWMAWAWHASGRADLSRSAFALAAQLSDEQYAVPSHPFTVALTTRSLRAAQVGEPIARSRPGEG